MKTALCMLLRAIGALLVALALLSPASAAERILNYDVAASLAADSVLTVTETIRVRSEGRQIRRGITRSYPVRQLSDDGTLRTYTFDIVSVKCDGQPSPYKRSDTAMVAGLAIGSADRLLPRGVHTYEIVFRSKGHVQRIGGEEQIYYNALGLDNVFPVERASFSLTLPAGVTPTRATAYTGRVGERGKDWKQTGPTRFETTRLMPRGHAFTVAVAFPEGTVALSPSWRETLSRYRTVLLILAALLTAGILFYGKCTVWAKPRGLVVMPLFQAPEGWTPGAAGNFMGSSAESTVLGDVLYAAVHGALRITEEGDRKTPFLVKTGTSDLPADVRTITDILLKEEKTDMSARTFGAAAERLVSRYTAANRKLTRFSWIPLVALAAGFAAFSAVLLLLWHPACSNDFDPLTLLFSITVLMVLIVLCVLALSGLWEKYRRAYFRLVFYGGGALLIIALLAVLYAALLEFDIAGALAFAALWLLPLWAFSHYESFTREGWEAKNALQGLKMYMETAEKERLARINAPEDTVERYEALLPYAVALGCAEAWEKRFEPVLRQAAYSPAWMPGQGAVTLGSMNRISRLAAVSGAIGAATASHAAYAAARSASRSSTRSSSGGGFRSSSGSGRGSGGGGVGGW